MSATAEDLKARLERLRTQSSDVVERLRQVQLREKAENAITAGQATVARLAGGEEEELELSRVPSSLEAFGRFAGGQIANNALAVPDLLATAGMRLGTASPLIEPPPDESGYQTPLPRVGERVLPIPRVEEIAAAARSIPEMLSGKSPSEAFGTGEQEQALYDQTLRELHPGASFAGELTGDVATLFTGRAAARSGGRSLTRAAAAESTIPRSMSVVPYMEPGLKRQLDEITRSVLSSKLTRGVGRAAETGLEGAVIAALHEGDPVETAALAAGSQAAGSLFLTLAKPMVSSSKNLMMAVAASTIAVHMFKEYTPGGPDQITESAELAITKVVPMFALGTIAAAAGFGRVRGSFSQNLPAFADAITTIPRGALVSALEDLTNDKDAQRVVEIFSQDPTALGPGAMLGIQRGLLDGNLSEEVSTLMESEEFRQMVNGQNQR